MNERETCKNRKEEEEEGERESERDERGMTMRSRVKKSPIQ